VKNSRLCGCKERGKGGVGKCAVRVRSRGKRRHEKKEKKAEEGDLGGIARRIVEELNTLRGNEVSRMA